MSKFASVMVFVVLGLGYFSLMCACRIAMWIGGRLGEAVRSGSPDMIVVGAFWMIGLCISSIVNVVFGCWAVTAVNGRYPDHAFYAMAVLVMFLIPLLATFLGMALLASKLKVLKWQTPRITKGTMMEQKKTGKQIVSKGRYAFNLGSKLALSSFGVIVFLIGGFCTACTCGLLGMGFMRFKWSELPLLVFVLLFMGGLSVALLYFGVGAVKEAKETDSGLPLTRANTADLPAPESLVRASSEPVQAHEALLLRAIIEAQGREVHEEQLLRAAAE